MEWGVAGLARLTAADIVVVIDVLRFSSTVIAALEQGESFPLDAAAHAVSVNGAAVAETAGAREAVVLLGGLRNASAVAAAVLAEQQRRAARTSVAVIAAGEQTDAGLRFAVEDQLGAGAVISALGALGIDHTSPDAAVAAEAYRALGRASTHLLTASGSGLHLIARGQRDEVLAAAARDAASVVPVLRGGVFVAF